MSDQLDLPSLVDLVISQIKKKQDEVQLPEEIVRMIAENSGPEIELIEPDEFVTSPSDLIEPDIFVEKNPALLEPDEFVSNPVKEDPKERLIRLLGLEGHQIKESPKNVQDLGLKPKPAEEEGDKLRTLAVVRVPNMTIEDGSLSLAKLAPIPANTLLGNPTNTTGSVTTIGLDPSLYFSGGKLVSKASGAGGGVESAIMRWFGSMGQTDFPLPDLADVLLTVSQGGLVLDPVDCTLSTNGDTLTIPALTANSIIQASYTVRAIIQ